MVNDVLDEIRCAVEGEAVDDALAYVEMRSEVLEALDPHDPLCVLADAVAEVRRFFNTNVATRCRRAEA